VLTPAVPRPKPPGIARTGLVEITPVPHDKTQQPEEAGEQVVIGLVAGIPPGSTNGLLNLHIIPGYDALSLQARRHQSTCVVEHPIALHRAVRLEEEDLADDQRPQDQPIAGGISQRWRRAD
jgi:hypothetical protein